MIVRCLKEESAAPRLKALDGSEDIGEQINWSGNEHRKAAGSATD
jgi:hypothetical protein